MTILDKIHAPEDVKKLDATQLETLCGEIRDFMIKSVADTGGHLASNLGVVELTVALHTCFDTPKDKIIWDVGHQAYVHKILTGRRDQFHTLRKFGGLSGFPKGKESPHDAFDTGHSSTSISAALGYAASRDLTGGDGQVVAVIGDGSMTGGMAFEALNNAGRGNSGLLVILNDNQMSISENVGALSGYLNQVRTAPSYLAAKADVHHVLDNIPFMGRKFSRLIEKTKDVLKYLLLPSNIFDEMGFTYVGPVDGHNLGELQKVLTKIKKMHKPVLLHVYTTKGKGYLQAEQAPSKFHGVDSFDVETGQPLATKIWGSYSDVFGQTMVELGHQHQNLVAITAAMPDGTGLAPFAKAFPNRLFDVGIAEGHGVTFAAGMAKNGCIPVFAVYSTFLQRGYDQLIHDVCLQNAHVVFAIDRAGIVGADGETHQGLFDLSYLTHMPNMTVMAPKNKREMIRMMDFAVTEHDGPIALRYPRGMASTVLNEYDSPIAWGKCEVIQTGKDVLIISIGTMMDTAFAVYEKLVQENGLEPTLVNARFAKPLDDWLVQQMAQYAYVFVLEENMRTGGFGASMLTQAATQGIAPKHFYAFAFPDAFVCQGSREELMKAFHMDVDSIYAKMKEDMRTCVQ